MAGAGGRRRGFFDQSSALWRLTPQPSAASVSLGLTAFGILITAWNTALFLQGA